MKANVNITIEANVSCFVVPNAINTAKDFFVPSDKMDDIISMNALNGVTTDPAKTPLVQIWWTSKDLHSENLGDHGFSIFDNDDSDLSPMMFRHGIRFPMSWIEHVPAALFEGHKEGDVIDLRFRHTFDTCSGEDGSATVTADFIFHTKLDQTHYRYRNFGNFEDILGRLMNKAGYSFNEKVG